MTTEPETDTDPMDVIGEYFVRKDQSAPFNKAAYLSFVGQTPREIEAGLKGQTFEFIGKAEYDAGVAAAQEER